ncbi:MAG TPA: TetR/AcrR family transcriptional regulator [Actinomycetes bacterium]|jgi:AcrR family transcriptional regulator|nr:TetR/AcrR family transcriptional regulator [Actinomycetes bacterium]
MSREAELNRTAAPPCPPETHTRRRGQTLERAIFDAVVYQLQTVGYVGLTMEGIASCAHTGKAALYRRWTHKEDLVVDALNHALPSAADLPDHGNVRDDLLDLLRRMAAMANSPAGCALQCLLAEIDRDHPFVRLVHERVLKPRKQMFLTVLQRGVERGEVRPEAVSPMVTEVGPAMVVQRFLADGPPVPDAFVVSVIDEIVMPLLQP